METLLQYIAAAIATDATSDERAAGARACRVILASLEPGVETQTPAASVATPAEAPLVQPAAVQAAVTALRSMSVDQLLELAISRLHAVVPAADAVTPPPGVKFHLINRPLEK